MIPVAAGSQTTAGTAGDGWRATRPTHPFTPAPLEPGARVRCRTCGAEKHPPRTEEPR